MAGAVAGLLALPGTVGVSAWGAQGHHVVARMAWALMTPAARAEAERLLGGGQDVFVAAATWADDVRSSRPETYNWHFVDIPADRAHYDAARDCRPTDKGDCVIAEIARARAELAEPGRPDALKAESLKFLIHFVGDVHQPLHAIDNHDRGGNDVKVAALRGEAGRDTNLHAAWDTGLINLSTETEAARATRLLDDLKGHPLAVSLDVVGWAEESHDVALRVAYRYPGFSLAGPPGQPIELDAVYRAAALTAIDRQLELGGARLASLLNALSDERAKASTPPH
jgi:nuclease S1